MGKRFGLLPTLMGLAVLLGPVAPHAGERWTQYSPFTTIIRMADGGDALWLATGGGLIRLDKATGENTYFNQANSALTDSRIRTVASDQAGRVWASTQAGMLVEFDGKTWRNLSAGSPLDGAAVLDLAWDFQGSLWVLAVEDADRKPSVFRRQDSQWTRLYLEGVDPMPLGFPENGYGHGYGFGYPFLYGVHHYYQYPASPIYLQAGGDGQAWVVARSQGQVKLYRITASGRVDAPEMPKNLVPRWLMVPRTGQPFWLSGTALFKPNGTGWDTLSLPTGYYGQISSHPRNSFAPSADGGFFLSLNGLVRFRDSLWKAEQVPGDVAGRNSLLIESEAGNACPGGACLRIARGGRLGRLAGDSWTFVQAGIAPIAPAPLEVLFPRVAGAPEILMGHFGGATSFHPSTGRATPLEMGAAWDSAQVVHALGEDRHGRIWVKGGRDLMSRVDGEGVKTFTPENSPVKGFSDFRPGAAGMMAVDGRGTLWVADSGKLIAIPDGSDDVRTWTVHRVPVPTGAEGVLVNSIALHPDGSLWVAGRVLELAAGVHNLVLRYDGKAWTPFDGSHHDWFDSSTVLDLRCDGKGQVWAHFRAGLLQWDGTTWKAHRPSPASPLRRGIQALTVDGGGRLWAATAPPEAGLLQWNDRWEAVADARERMATSAVRSMVFDAAGRLWMTMVGDAVMVFDPSGQVPTAVPAAGRPSPTLPPSLARQADGSWRLSPGPLAGEDRLTIRILDLRGAVVPGTAEELRRPPGGKWTWRGPMRRLPPGVHLLSLQGGRSRQVLLPFLPGLP